MDAGSSAGKFDFLFDEAEGESVTGLLRGVAIPNVKFAANRRFWG
jgi:hypothetical protein